MTGFHVECIPNRATTKRNKPRHATGGHKNKQKRLRWMDGPWTHSFVIGMLSVVGSATSQTSQPTNLKTSKPRRPGRKTKNRRKLKTYPSIPIPHGHRRSAEISFWESRWWCWWHHLVNLDLDLGLEMVIVDIPVSCCAMTIRWFDLGKACDRRLIQSIVYLSSFFSPYSGSPWASSRRLSYITAMHLTTLYRYTIGFLSKPDGSDGNRSSTNLDGR